MVEIRKPVPTPDGSQVPVTVKESIPAHNAPYGTQFPLLLQPDQRPQPEFDGFFLGFDTRRLQRIRHEGIINNYVGSHDVYLLNKLYTSTSPRSSN